jgi:deoxyuridine 5'-triphosphate nucleotidohydrolase
MDIKISCYVLYFKAKMSASQNNAVPRFVKLTEHAQTPTRGSPKSAGLDLHSAYDTTVPARGKALVSTDLKIQLPTGCCGRIAPRSGLPLRHHIDVGGGVVHEDYRGKLSVFSITILTDHSLFHVVIQLLIVSVSRSVILH